jgi:hypothetical protein
VKISKQNLPIVVLVGCLVCLSLLGLGCSGSSVGGTGTASVTSLLTVDSARVAPLEPELVFFQGPVGLGETESLTLTITEISLDRWDDEDEYEPKIVVFSGAMDVDILDLTDISAVLSCVDVPAGVYTKIRLSIENPRLILDSDPETVITDIHLTANGRLFISEEFELPDGGFYLLILHFESIHLVEQGNGGYVLTPQLRATIEIEPREARVCGTIVDIDKDTDTFTLAMCEGSEIHVSYNDASIFLPCDTDTATGTEDDLDVGVFVIIRGTLWVDGSLTADSIRII